MINKRILNKKMADFRVTYDQNLLAGESLCATLTKLKLFKKNRGDCWKL
jgi:hypothetical protein